MATDADLALIPGQLADFYSAQFSYYKSLDERYRGLFIRRCLQFISDKEMAGGEGFVLTNKVKALIAASAVQLTLGLETWKLSYFENIVIYPADFESISGGLRYKGETNIAGFIKLSWKSFTSGYVQAHDNINLGLHEFAHALRFNGIRGSAQDYFFEHYFNSWLAAAYEAYSDLRSGEETLFRKYGGTNINEFASVCIEHFFESPQAILQRYPQLYYATAILLNQEPGATATRIGVRPALFEKKNALLPGFTEQHYHTALLHQAFFGSSLAVLFLWGLTVSTAGLWTVPCIFLMGLWLMMYLRFDYQFTRLSLQAKSFTLEKGLFLFRGARKKQLPLAMLVSFGNTEVSAAVTKWRLVFYNPANDYFYEERVHGPTARTAEIKRELAANKIASLNF